MVTQSRRTIRIGLTAALCASALTLWPPDASAQRRGRPSRGRVAIAYPAYFGYGYYSPFWWGHPGWYPYDLYPGYYGYGLPGSNAGSARLQIKPQHAEVYVDGYFAGTVDSFDGFLQRLQVPAGEHELTVYLEGYQALTQKVLFAPGSTVNIKGELQALAAGEVTGPRPQAAAVRERPAAAQSPGAGGRSSTFGTLAIRVQPSDAILFIDGEEWTAPEGAGPILIELGEGPHEVEIRKSGFSTFRRSVRVRAGDTVSLNVSLSK